MSKILIFIQLKYRIHVCIHESVGSQMGLLSARCRPRAPISFLLCCLLFGLTLPLRLLLGGGGGGEGGGRGAPAAAAAAAVDVFVARP